MIEDGMGWSEAITSIRDKRKGALNNIQLTFLITYEARARKHSKCIIF